MSRASRVALVTGAGSGIGRAAALALVRDGFTVVLAGRRREALELVGDEVATLGGHAVAMSCDVTSEDEVRSMFGEIEASFGRLDLLFNNAGISSPAAPLDEVTLEQFAQVVACDVTGVFLCTRAAFALMKRQEPMGGRIINNGSLSAYVPRPNAIAYNASKHAVSGITKSTALEGRPFNIACGQIDVGNASTSMTEAMSAGVTQADGTVRAEPRMDVDEVGRAVAYMASLPLEANVLSMTVLATTMPFTGRG